MMEQLPELQHIFETASIEEALKAEGLDLLELDQLWKHKKATFLP